MAFWGNKITGKQKSGDNINPVYCNGGLNRKGSIFDLGPHEAWDMSNMANIKDNVLSTRLGSSSYATLTTDTHEYVNAVWHEDMLHVIDNGVWKQQSDISKTSFDLWDAIMTLSYTHLPISFVEFNTDVAKYLIMSNSSQSKVWDGNTLTDLSNFPHTYFITVDDYRIYALLDNCLYCSAEGSMNNWDPQIYEDDADKIPITSMEGYGTAITTHNDTVICFSDQTMHVLYGNDPTDFEFSESKPHGCISFKSIVHKNGTYFLDYGEYKRYTSGNNPEVVSDKIKYWLDRIDTGSYHDITASTWGKYIYLSIAYAEDGYQQGRANNITFEFNTETGNWYKWDEGYQCFATHGEDLYAIPLTGPISKLNTGTTTASGGAISYSYDTGMINNAFNKQTLSSIPLIINSPANSLLEVYINVNVNNPSWEKVYTCSTSIELQNVTINIPTDKYYDVNWYQFRFAGHGPNDIYMMGVDKRIKLR